MMKMKRWRVLLALLLVAALSGCGGETAQETQPDVTVPSQAEEIAATEAQVQEETQAPTVPQATAPQNCVVVSTPYGNFQYQDQWIEFMRVEQHAEGNSLRVAFSAEINNVRYGLFELLIGEDMMGTPIGTVTDAEGVQRDVYVHMMEIVPSAALTDAELNRLYAMQEDINYIIENMK